MTKHSQWLRLTTVVGMVAIGLVACSNNSDEANLAAQQQAVKAKRVAKQAQPDDPLARMVKAVTASKGDLPVDVRFELGARPEPGKPVDIKLAFASSADLAALHATIKAANGLQTAPDLQAKFESVKSGEIKDYTFSVTPAATGIYIANLELTVTRDTGDNTYVYVIPVAVPNPAPPAASSAAAAMGAG